MRGRWRGVMVGAVVVLCGPVWAADGVLYCVEENSSGFAYRDGRYEPRLFTEQRYTMKLDGDTLTVTTNGRSTRLGCNASTIDGREVGINCRSYLGEFISYNAEDGRFARALTYGNTFNRGDERDTVSISIGTCSPF